MDARIWLQGGGLGHAQHVINGRQFRSQVRSGRIRGADDGRCFSSYLLVRLKRSFPLLVFQSKVFGLVGRAPINKRLCCCSDSREALRFDQETSNQSWFGD